MIDKQKVARSFSRCATSYDQVAYLQRDVGQQLLTQFQSSIQTSLNQKTPHFCLDLGCGTGFFQKSLSQLEWVDHYIGLDIAEGMLHFASRTQAESQSFAYVCADAERLPFAEKSISSIFSNMALQWCEDLPRLLSELAFVLNDDGVMALTTLGPSTLGELKRAWAQVDDRVHVNHFVDNDCWRSAFERHGFKIEQHQNQLIELQYPSVRDLLKELKLLGAHNMNEGQPKGLTLPKHLNALFEAYEKDVNNMFHPATYEVDYWIVLRSA